ncbi:MAG: DUF1800 family protein [Alphaproteobacteria bacterium]|nr:DUF1800 family protein [Alphaproteobacteria bacterium]
MKNSTLWSLLLGYSTNQETIIETNGLEAFCKQSFKADYMQPVQFIQNTIPEWRILREKNKALKDDTEEKKAFRKEYQSEMNDFLIWWLQQMQQSAFPLREKMTSFWQNHFVVTFKKVRFNKFIYEHNALLREHAFGNFRELTKKILYNNAMNVYLDNFDNKVGSINENLSRELLELFTIGIGNYSEKDIKNGAKGLAGLMPTPIEARYAPRRMDNETIEYFGKKGTFKIDKMVDIIFKQQQTPFLLTKKLLQWFITDYPTPEQIKTYGDFFRKVDFEMQPLLIKMFTDFYSSRQKGVKIKDPISFLLPILSDWDLKINDSKMLGRFFNLQGMLLYDQPNVKGWVGGENWMSTQSYDTRRDFIHRILFYPNFTFKKLNLTTGSNLPEIRIAFDNQGNNKTILEHITNHWLFEVSPVIQKDLETLLKHDFNPQAPNAQDAVKRVYDYLLTKPEIQVL